jgi:hypothetical protein
MAGNFCPQIAGPSGKLLHLKSAPLARADVVVANTIVAGQGALFLISAAFLKIAMKGPG